MGTFVTAYVVVLAAVVLYVARLGGEQRRHAAHLGGDARRAPTRGGQTFLSALRGRGCSSWGRRGQTGMSALLVT